MFPSFLLSRAANFSSSVLKSWRTRMLICAFHSPIDRLISYAAWHLFTTKGMPADNGVCDLFAVFYCAALL